MERFVASVLLRVARGSFRTVTILVFCAAISAVHASSAHAAPFVSVSSTMADIDDVIDWIAVNVNISDVNDLYAYQLGIAFDPLIVNVFDVVEGGFLSSAGPTLFNPGFFDNAAGRITFSANTLLGPVSGANGSGVLFTILFTAVEAGVTNVTPILDPLNGDGLLDSALLPIEAIGSSGTITLEGSTSLPEPATLLLVSLGIASRLLKHRCRRGARSAPEQSTGGDFGS